MINKLSFFCFVLFAAVIALCDNEDDRVYREVKNQDRDEIELPLNPPARVSL